MEIVECQSQEFFDEKWTIDESGIQSELYYMEMKKNTDMMRYVKDKRWLNQQIKEI